MRGIFQIEIAEENSQIDWFWQYRYTWENDGYHKKTLSKKKRDELGKAKDKLGCILADFLYFYYKKTQMIEGKRRHVVSKKQSKYSLLVADFDKLPSGFNSYAKLRDYLRVKYPSALVLPSPSGKAKVIFLVRQDIRADSHEYGPRWHALKALLAEERLFCFDHKVVASYKVYFNAEMLRIWEKEHRRLKLLGSLSSLAEAGGYSKKERLEKRAVAELTKKKKLRLGKGSQQSETSGYKRIIKERKDSEKSIRKNEAIGDSDDHKDHHKALSENAKTTKNLTRRLYEKLDRPLDGESQSLLKMVSFGANLREKAAEFSDQRKFSEDYRALFDEEGADLERLDYENSLSLEREPCATVSNLESKRKIRRATGSLASELKAIGGRSRFFEDFLRLIIATPKIDRSAPLPMVAIAREVGASVGLIHRFIRRLISARLLFDVDKNYVKGKKAKGYRAYGLLVDAHRDYAAIWSRHGSSVLSPAEKLVIPDGSWNKKLFELTNYFFSEETYLSYVKKIPGIDQKKTRWGQARWAWKKHAERNGLMSPEAADLQQSTTHTSR